MQIKVAVYDEERIEDTTFKDSDMGAKMSLYNTGTDFYIHRVPLEFFEKLKEEDNLDNFDVKVLGIDDDDDEKPFIRLKTNNPATLMSEHANKDRLEEVL